MKKIILAVIVILTFGSGCSYVTDFLLKDIEVSGSPSPTPTKTPTPVIEDVAYVTRIHGIDYWQAEDAEPQYGGTLNIYSLYRDTFNPLLTNIEANREMLRLVFDSLIFVDSTLRPQPLLAKSWSVGGDRLSWTIRLRDDILWQDGTIFTADDAVASLEIARTQGSVNYSSWTANIDRIEKIGDYELLITLKAPQSGFISMLDIPIVKATEAEKFEDFAPIGTGAFAITEVNREYLILSRNEYAVPQPYLDNIRVTLLPERDAAFFAYESRGLDYIKTKLTEVSDFTIHSSNRLSAHDTTHFNYVGINMTNSFLSHLAVRRALSHSINKNSLLSDILLNNGKLVDSYINPAWWFYTPTEFTNAYDVELAKSLIEGVRATPEPLTMLIAEGNKLQKQLADRIIDNMADIGVTVTLEAAEPSVYEYKVKYGIYDLYIGEYAFSPDVDVMQFLKYTAPTSGKGVNSYSDMELLFLPLVSSLNQQTTDHMRKVQHAKIAEKFAEQLPCIPLFYDVDIIMYDKSLSANFGHDSFNIFSDIKSWHKTN